MARRSVRRYAPVDTIPPRIVEKVTSNVEVGPDGCLLTLQGLGSHGYGQVGWTEDGVSFAGVTHRVIYIAMRGPIPEGFDVHHKCFNRRCVNIEHLDAIPAFQNRRRHSGQDWDLGVCKFGHSDLEMIQVGKKRRCGPCFREQMRVCYARHRAKRKEERLSAHAQ